MDWLIYVAMTGAKHTMGSQAATAHNLANAATTGYRAESHALRAAPVLGEGAPTRAFVVDSTAGSDFRSGPIQHTGRELDIAIQGSGWIAVETNGILQIRGGLNVLGDGGPISIPPDHWGYHPAGLQSMGEDLYVETASSGTAGVNTPGTTTKTTKLLNQGYNEYMKSCEREFESKREAKSLSRKEPQIPTSIS